MMVHAYNHSTQKAETGGSRVQGHPGLYNETLTQIKIQNLQKEISRGVCLSFFV
jgi:hypothetical protein